MFAVIMCGGLGTRLRELFPDSPKLLVPVSGKPFIEHQLDWLVGGGISRIHVAAGHLGEQIETYVRENPRAGLTVSVSIEPAPLGTGGALKYIEERLSESPFFVINGDTLLPEVEFHAMRQAALSADATMSIAVTRIEASGRYGSVVFDENLRVSAFLEKTVRDAGWVNGGVYLIDKSILSLIKPHTKLSLEAELLPELVKDKSVTAFRTAPPLLDMGTPDGITAMESYLAGS